jgi:hypothetical protein
MGPQIRIITSEICQVGGPGQTDQSDAAIYLVHFADSAALIDAGSGRASDRVLMNIEAAGVLPEQVQYLLLTHCHYDHTGGAAAFRQRFGWRVAIHSLEATALERATTSSARRPGMATIWPPVRSISGWPTAIASCSRSARFRSSTFRDTHPDRWPIWSNRKASACSLPRMCMDPSTRRCCRTGPTIRPRCASCRPCRLTFSAKGTTASLSARPTWRLSSTALLRTDDGRYFRQAGPDPWNSPVRADERGRGGSRVGATPAATRYCATRRPPR